MIHVQKKLNTYKNHQVQLHCAIKDIRSATQFQKLISATQKALSRNKTRRNCNIQEFILYLSNYGLPNLYKKIWPCWIAAVKTVDWGSFEPVVKYQSNI
jgi:hypothetical protein